MIGRTNAITQTGIDTSDATAVVDDISLGKTAYVNGEKLIGTNRYKDEFIEFVDGTGKHLTLPFGLTAIGDYKFYRGTFETVTLPSTLTSIGYACFINSSLREITIPESITVLRARVFEQSALEVVNIPDSLITIGSTCFSLTKLINLTLPIGVTDVAGNAFQNISTLKTITIMNKDIIFGSTSTFKNCTAIEEVNLPDNFNGKRLDLSASTLFSVEKLVSLFEKLADLTGLTSNTLIIGPDNIAKLTDEQKAIPVSKNWTLA